MMVFSPFLRRELDRSIRKGWALNDRLMLVLVLAAMIVAAVLVWDWYDWDRQSIGGERTFASTTLALAGLALGAMAATMAFTRVAPAIAGDRDRKALDALLTTELNSAEIVVGTMAEGLLRAANALAATLPVVLFAFVAGVDLRLILLGAAAIASTALVVAAFSVVASVESPAVNKAIALATGLIMTWLVVPYSVLLFLPVFLPLFRLTPPRWLIQAALCVLDSSPIGLAFTFMPAVPRPGTFAERALWMIGLQLIIALALGMWAAWRLRPVSRSLYDAQGRSAFLRMLRLANRRLRALPPCGDDPVYWLEINADRGRSPINRLEKLGMELFGYGVLAIGTSWFAVPAFTELAERGYRVSREAFTMPEINPLARVLINHLILPIVGPSKAQSLGDAAAGQARLEFNIALRQFSACIVCCYIISLLSLGTQSVNGERTRDTWLGLLATPLSGRDVVGGKVRGVKHRNRGGLWLLVLLWFAGLVTGAIHPLGFVAACAGLMLLGALYAAGGVATGLWAGVERDPDNPVIFLLRVVFSVVGIVLLVFVPSALTMAVLFTYEDVHAILHGLAYPPFGAGRLSIIGARTVAFASLALMAAGAFGTRWFTHKLYREFDALVGRPVRSPGPAPAPSFEPGSSSTTIGSPAPTLRGR